MIWNCKTSQRYLTRPYHADRLLTVHGSVVDIVVLHVLHFFLLFLAVSCFIVQPAQKLNIFTTYMYMQTIAIFRHAQAFKKLASLAFHRQQYFDKFF